MRFWLIAFIIVLVLVGGSTVAYQRGWLERPGPKFLTVAVSRGRVETMVNSTGTVKPVRSVSVGAFTSGPMLEVLVDFNSVVKKNELLARIDPRLFQAAVRRDEAFLKVQKADLARIEALLQQAKNNEGRARKLVAINPDYLSDQEMDQFRFSRMALEAQKDLAVASIAQAKATLTNSETNLIFTEIRSPVSGLIIERKVDPGQTVVSSFQTAELFVVAPDMEKHMHIFASVDEADIGMIRSATEKGMAVKFTVDAYPNDLFEGKIYQIRNSSTTTQNVVTYPVVIETPNPGLKLRPGMTANISFQIEAKDDVLRLPAIALRFQPQPAQVRPEDRHYVEAVITPTETGTRRSAKDKANAARSRFNRVVWAQEERFLRAVPVKLGLMESQYAEILESELTEGQLIVTGMEARK
ncbi:MAG: efflux RND transporter periplasmic adaptor subunit [Planctomycetes bacterium]|jgi:HlyD family secretion protein|nr:efflux RND transporter periplasmic adaptor subunit [Planctomycetota bacterium]